MILFDPLSGNFVSSGGGGGSGSVTSVGITTPSILTVTNSPITTSGDIALALANQNANLVFAGPSTGVPAAPTFRSLVAADIPTLASYWNIAGNTGLVGGKLGTTDANNWDIIAGNSTIITVVESYKGLSAAPTIIPADATGVNQFDWRTFVSPSSSTTGASHTTTYAELIWDNPAAGFNNSSGSLIASSGIFTKNGGGTVNYASSISSSGNFNNGTVTQYKGLTNESGIVSGATVSDYYGVVSGLNTTGGILGTYTGYSQYSNFTDCAISSTSQGVSQNITFSGTTAQAQGVNGYNSYLQFNNSTTVANSVFGYTGGIDVNNTAVLNGIYSFNSYYNLRDTSDSGFVYGLSLGLNQEDSAVIDGASAININYQLAGDATAGNVILANLYCRTFETIDLDSFTGINMNPELEGSSVVDNVSIASFGGQLRGSATFQNVSGLSVSIQLSGSAAATNFNPVSINPQITGSATLTNGLTIVDVNPTVSNAAGVSTATGLNVNMSSVSLSAAAIAAGEKVKALAFSGSIEGGSDYTIPSALSFFQNHYIGGSVIVANGAPVSAFGFGMNLAQGVVLHDDWTLDGAGLGFCAGGFVGSIAFDTGTTMARWTGALGGAGNPSGAGTLTDAIMFRAAGILPQGGALTVTNAYGFQVDPNLFGLTGTNAWGFYEDNSAVQNHVSKLAIGTANKKVTNSDTALEIGNSKMLLLGSGSTAVKSALTPIESGLFYDSTLKQFQFYNGTSWISPSGGTYGQYDGTSLIDGVNQVFTLPNTPIQAKAVWVHFNGSFQLEGVGYTISGAVITTIPFLTASETLEVVYIY